MQGIPPGESHFPPKTMPKLGPLTPLWIIGTILWTLSMQMEQGVHKQKSLHDIERDP